jgi:hypothetical protein
MQSQNIIRAFLFAVFFGIGAAALGGSILCDDLIRYFHNKQMLKKAEVNLNRLKSLNDDYDALLHQLEDDPNLVKRIAPATIGTEPAEEQVIYPRATAEQLAAARAALTEDVKHQDIEPAIPDWIVRCSRPSRKIILFFAGASLILISFVCFRPAPLKSSLPER